MKIAEHIEEDRRAFERFNARFPVRFKDSRNDYGTNISLRNASAQGAQITTKQRLYLNDSVILEVELPDYKEPMTLSGQVVWVTGDESGMWDIGLKFHAVDLMHMSRLYKFVMPAITSV
ncbi:MAG: PilZ domain-containing protein [Candidatus Omnitrophica bacterium]|nr:PilZ domain-containing protein [Candidatus Omnitrophota bacterium]